MTAVTTKHMYVLYDIPMKGIMMRTTKKYGYHHPYFLIHIIYMSSRRTRRSSSRRSRRTSPWMIHVKKTMKANRGKSLAECLKIASKSYK